jgi:hypothetical protein
VKKKRERGEEEEEEEKVRHGTLDFRPLQSSTRLLDP